MFIEALCLKYLRSISSNMRSLRPRVTVQSENVDNSSNDTTGANEPMKKSPRKRKDVKVKSPIKDIKSEKDSSNDSDVYAKQIKLEVSKDKNESNVSPRKSNLVKNIKVKKEATDSVNDIEDAGWEPSNWKEVWENILKMRKLHIAPVDSLGCEECPEKDVTPKVFRYQTLISVMLSSQTKDQVTYAATQRLIEHGLNVDNILNTSDEKLGELIYPAGFWKSKVQYIKQTTKILKEQYDGDIPHTLKELCELPGVGPKMANIVMSVGWQETVGIAVDTHVHRISNRLGWVQKTTKNPEQTRKALESWLPKELWKDASLQLVGFGQTICKPIKPKCKECLNSNICPIGKNA